MAQNLIQTQEQKQVQQQRLTQQQLMVVRMLEMPLTEFEESVNTEIDDNPALEIVSDSQDPAEFPDSSDDTESRDSVEAFEQEERQSELDSALQNIGMDDGMPEVGIHGASANDNADYEEITYGNQKSFYDSLKEQMAETEMTALQSGIMEYLIGSLDGDGLLRKSLDSIADELAIYHDMDVSEQDVEQVLVILQGFDPAGIGARSLQECLLLQIVRRPVSVMRTMMHDVIEQCFDSFMSKHWDKIASHLDIDEDTVRQLKNEILKLNPKPGASLGETEGRNVQQITPDFVVDTADDGEVTFYINKGRVPELSVSPAFADMLSEYRNNSRRMSRQAKEALLYARQKVERARSYIEAVKQRQHTMYVTMKAIVDMQRAFFRSGDEGDLQPMVLKDVAQRTGLDISTISRVSTMKYAQTRWGTFRLRHFFSEGIKNDSGEELSTRKLKAALKDIIDEEDKRKPLNDDLLRAEMEKRGYAIARRTISKYREQLGIPVARLRKK